MLEDLLQMSFFHMLQGLKISRERLRKLSDLRPFKYIFRADFSPRSHLEGEEESCVSHGANSWNLNGKASFTHLSQSDTS